MNHTYRLVWSPTQQRYVPTAETARSRGKCSGGKALLPAAVVLSTALLGQPSFAQAPPALAPNALPTGGQVVAGQASIGQQGSQMTITQGTDKAILNWNSFNIGQDARVQFQQPGSGAVALNRVVAGDASQIQGQLSANGQVWLVNPNGVVFGAGSRVDVGGLVASTLNITNQDFLDGKAIFNRDGATGGIVNEGQITAVGGGERGGLIALLAPTVRNDGVLTAKLGSVALAAGERITLNAGAGGLLQVEVEPATLHTLVENRQMIVADGGQVVMTGKAADALSGSVVANTGTVQARSIGTQQGRIMLLGDAEHGSVQVSGLLDASAPSDQGAGAPVGQALHAGVSSSQVSASRGQGGSIEVTGKQVALTSATLDTSGATGGGDIKVGGGWQGGGTLARAKTTTVDAASRLKADATQKGDGGKVVVWSDDKTRYAGHISAKGGSKGGNGGKAEVSGKAVLNLTGTADLSAAQGRSGDLLLDPYNMTITSGSGGTPDGSNNFVAGANDSTLGVDTLTTLLATANVTVSTGGVGSPGSQAGDITVNAPVAWSANNVLTLEAAGDIAINKNITATGTSAGLVLSHGTGKDYQIGEGASVTLSGASASLKIGATGALNTYTLLRDVNALQAIPASSTGRFALAGDIDAAPLSSGAGFAPIMDFGGTFTGLGHVVNGLVINRPGDAYVGLFGDTNSSSTLRNVGLIGGSMMGGGYTGGLAGLNRGALSHVNTTGTVHSSDFAVVGTGGLVGQNEGSVRHAYATGAVTGVRHTGGLVGNNRSTGTLTEVYATGTVTGTEEYAGGLVGRSDGAVTHAYATGAVRGATQVGGLAGANTGAITDSYSAGAVTSTTPNRPGGLIGQHTGTVTRSFYATTQADGSVINNAGVTDSVWTGNNVGTAKTRAELMTASTFTGWNTAIWNIARGNTAPGYEVGLPALTGVTPAATIARSTLFQGGMGNAGNPYGITDWQQLANINQVLASGYTFNLGNNLDGSSGGYALLASATANGGLGWKPLGDVGTPFVGTFDGQNHVISGLIINRPLQDDAGLFGRIGSGGTVRNIGIAGASVIGRYQAGALAGFGASGSTITSAYASGEVTGQMRVGGLVGASQGAISRAYASAIVTAATSGGGGLAGLNSGAITDSYATGAVSGGDEIGGLVGSTSSGSIDHVYATGAVSGSARVGGLVGLNEATLLTPVTNAFYATTDLGGSTINNGGGTAGVWTGNAEGTGKTRSELMSPATFSGWNTSTWTFARGNLAPGYETGLLPALTGVTRTADMVRTTLFQGGMGTAGNPYGITDWQQLANISQVLTGAYTFNLNNNLDGSSGGYALLASATANGGLGWKPLGSYATSFKGTLIGQDHTISGLVINRPAENTIGLFGVMDAGGAIRNLGLLGVNITGSGGVGALVGASQPGSTISRVYASGAVSGSSNVGGLVGINVSDISQSYTSTTVAGSNASAGGLIGSNSGVVTDSYATGTVAGRLSAGGLVGFNSGTIERAYSTGTVSGTGNLGGLAGFNDPSFGVVADSFYATTSADGSRINNGGVADATWVGNNAGTAKTHAELMAPATFTGWNPAIWNFGLRNAAVGYEVGLPALTGVTRAADMVRTTLFQGGMGIAGNPYGIADWQQLANINQVLAGGYTFNLDNNLDASSGGYGLLASASADGGQGWKTLGDSTSSFAGTFDGQNHTISSLVINRPTQQGVGLFGRIANGSAVRNIGVLNANVIGQSFVGALVGNSAGSSTIYRAYSTGDVKGQGDVGGLVGANQSALSRSYSTATVAGSVQRVGGLVGSNRATITDSYATGAVTGGISVGGLVGSNAGAVDRTYATGAVSGTNATGGAVGFNEPFFGVSVSNTFYATTDTVGGINNGGATDSGWSGNSLGTAKTRAELMNHATFTGWDPSIWTFARGNLVPGYESGLLPALTGVTRAIDMQRTTLFQGGMGTTLQPYGITDWQQLANIDQVLPGGYTFDLNNNLDSSSGGYNLLAAATANGGLGWKPLANSSTPFIGTFDGKNRSISNLVINRPLSDEIGLFGYLGNGSLVRNIGVVDANVLGRNSVGALAGASAGGSTIAKAYASGDVKGVSSVGGLIGGNQSSISDAYASATVNASQFRAGGLAGTSLGTITRSYATGAVSGSGENGGLVGLNQGIINHAYATGGVLGNDFIGGLVGQNDGNIDYAYATGTVSGMNRTGGLVGGTGIVMGTVSNAFYATRDHNGFLINNDGSTGAHWTGNVYATAKTLAELRAPATFASWGANLATAGGSTAIWRIYAGNTTPLLRSFLQAATVTADLSAASRTYNGTIASGTAPYTSNVAGPLLGTLKYASNGANAGTYATADSSLQLGGLYSGQQGYDISYAPASLAITPVVLVPGGPGVPGNTPSIITGILAGTVRKTYDGTNVATLGSGNFQLSGWVSNDGAIVTKTVGRYDNANAGSGKTVTVDLALGDYQATGTTDLGNYLLPTQISGAVGTVDKAALTVSANNAIKTYDGQAWRDGNGVAYSGFVNGETTAVLTGVLSYGGTSQGAVEVGNYLLTPQGLNSGNYAIDYRNGTLSVASISGGNPGSGNPGAGNPGSGSPGTGNPGSANPGGGDAGGGNIGGGNSGSGSTGGGTGGVGTVEGNSGGNGTGNENAGNGDTFADSGPAPSGSNLWRALNRATPPFMLPQDTDSRREISVPHLSLAPGYIRLQEEETAPASGQ